MRLHPSLLHWLLLATAAMLPTQAQEIYCEPNECYAVLGVAQDASFQSIKRAYRKLARVYHPDTSTAENAEARFREVALAMEILSDPEERAEYDYYLEHPEEAFYNKMRYYRRRYAPKSDPFRVVTVFCLFVSGLQYFLQRSMYNKALDYYKKNDKKFRLRVKQLAYEELQRANKNGNASGSGASTGSTRSRKKRKEKEQKEEMQAIEARITEELAKEVDIQGGYQHPKLQDLFIVRVVIFPYTFVKYVWWKGDWVYRHDVKGEPLSEHEKMYLAARAFSTSIEGLEHMYEPAEIEEMKERKVWLGRNKEVSCWSGCLTRWIMCSIEIRR